MEDQQDLGRQERELLEARYRTLHAILFELATGTIRQSLPDSVLAPVYAFYYREYAEILTRLSAFGVTVGSVPTERPAQNVEPRAASQVPEHTPVRSLLARHTIGILAMSGAFLLGIATLLFVAYGTQFGRLPRLGAVILLYMILGAVSFWSSRKDQLRDVFLIYVLLFALMTPLVFLGLYRFVIEPNHALSPLWMLTIGALCCGFVYESLGWRLSSLWYSGFGAGACGVAWCAFSGAVLTQQWAVVLIGAGGLLPVMAQVALPTSVPEVVRRPMRALSYGIGGAALVLGIVKLASLSYSTLFSSGLGLPEIPLWMIVLLAVTVGVALTTSFLFKKYADIRITAIMASVLLFVLAGTVAVPYHEQFCQAQGCLNMGWLQLLGIRTQDLVAGVDVLLALVWWVLYKLRVLGEDSQSTLAIGLLLTAFVMLLPTSSPVVGLVFVMCAGAAAIGMQRDLQSSVWRVVPMFLALDVWQQLLHAFLFITGITLGRQWWLQWYSLFPFVLVGMDGVLHRAVPRWSGTAVRSLVYIVAGTVAAISVLVAVSSGYDSTAGWTLVAYGLLSYGIGKREKAHGMAVLLGSLGALGILLIVSVDGASPFPTAPIALAAWGLIQIGVGRFGIDSDKTWERWHFWVGISVVVLASVEPLGHVNLPLQGNIALTQVIVSCILAVVILDGVRDGGILCQTYVGKTVWRMVAVAITGFSLDWIMAMGSSVTPNGVALTIIPSAIVTIWVVSISPRQKGSDPSNAGALRFVSATASSILLLGTFTECWTGSAAVWYIALLLVESVLLIAAGVAKTQRIPTIVGGIGAVAAACAAISELASNFPLYVVFAVVAVLLIVASTILAVARSRMLASGNVDSEKQWDRWF